MDFTCHCGFIFDLIGGQEGLFYVNQVICMCILKVYNNHFTGLLAECGKKWKIVRKILPNSAGNSVEKSKIVRENAK